MNSRHSHAALIAYLKKKVEEQDWPAVSDAANDLSIFEILEARSMTAPRRENERRPAASDA